MRILVLIYEFPPVGGGGGEAAYQLCKELVRRGHQITVITSHIHGLAHEEILDGIKLIRISALRKYAYVAPFSTMLAYILAGLWPGYRYIRSNRPQIIHAHFAVPSGVLAWALSLITNVPYMLTVHLGDIPGGVPEKTGKWFRWIKPFTIPVWKRASRIVAVSEYTRQLASEAYAQPMVVIHNATNIKENYVGNITLHRPTCLIFSGRFMLQKNPLQVVNILAQLPDLDWRCKMLGDGPLFNEVKRRIIELGLSDRFELLGWVQPKEVLTQLSNSDILLMPSLSEGLPLTGIQALAKGLALVVSKVGGFIDLVEHGKNGFLIAPNNQDQFVLSLNTLIANPDRLMQFRLASLEKAREFDVSRVVLEYEELYQHQAGS